MEPREAADAARKLLSGELSTEAFTQLVAASTAAPLAEMPGVTLDLDRRRRCGFPEVIYGEGKDARTIASIIERLLVSEVRVLTTRVPRQVALELLQIFPGAHYNNLARTFRVTAATDAETESRSLGYVPVVTAGTTDLPVAEEARETLDWMQVRTQIVADVGVAGPQRLIAKLPLLAGADAVVCAAGMEAALPSVLGGYVDCPVIAVPTSVGYGASFGGVTALLGMLNSCASNVTVVNIDAGFKAGYVAGVIATRAARKQSQSAESE